MNEPEKTVRRRGGGIRKPTSPTQSLLARASRACPDRLLRVLPGGILEIAPAGGQGAEPEPEKNPLDRILDAPRQDGTS